MDLLRERSSFVNQALVPPIFSAPGDRRRAAPPQDRWWLAIRKTRVISRASELRCPTLLCVGRHDPQTPVKISEAIHNRVPDSQLEIFERSGHSPFLEEPERFAQVLTAFLQ
jgi:pimeloyl-ACP methyl ester carboxylesterase